MHNSNNLLNMDSGPQEMLVLLFSYSYEDGVIMPRPAFTAFLGLAPKSEVQAAHYAFIPASSDLIRRYEYVDLLDVQELFCSVHVEEH